MVAPGTGFGRSFFVMKLTTLVSLFLFLAVGSAATLHVSPVGDDRNSGATAAAPIQTLTAAQTRVRKIRAARPAEPVTVMLRAGVYELSGSLRFGPEDSGAPGAPVRWVAAPGAAVHLSGGRAVKAFTPVRDPATAQRFDEAYREFIVEADLAAQGIREYGVIQAEGPAGVELFYGGRPMTLARWPDPSAANKGWFTIAWVPDGSQGDRFIYVGGRPRRWLHAPDAWLHGFWVYDWWATYERIKEIRPDEGLIVFDREGVVRARMADQTTGKVINRNFSSVGRRYYAVNILEELDEPGEWYLDRRNGKLYFYPPEPVRPGQAHVSVLTGPLLDLRDASHIRFQGFIVEYGRGNAVEIRGGEGIALEDCRLRNVGNNAVTIEGGQGHTVARCEITGTGDGGVLIQAGDPKTLTPARHAVRDCDIHHYSRWRLTYRAAVNLKGVGSIVEHNRIRHAPHAGVLLDGNDHRVDFNEFSELCLESDDCGAFYANGLNRTARGNQVRNNVFRAIRGIGGKSQAPAVYLDDFMGGTTISGNVFHRVYGVKIGGGRDNLVENNIFVDCDPALSLDGRGLGWASASFADIPAIQKELEAVKYREPPYRDRYPGLLTYLDDNPGMPKGNRIVRNIFTGGKGWIQITPEVDRAVVEVRDNYLGHTPGFVDRAKGDFRLRPDAPPRRMGFQPLPLERVGPRPRRQP